MTREKAHRAWRSAERIKRLSDRIVAIGPFGLGLDGVLAWVPGANVIYSVAAGGLLLYEGASSGAAPRTLALMGLYLLADSASSGVPVVGWAVDTLFPGHLMAAKALQKDIEARQGPRKSLIDGSAGAALRPRREPRGVSPSGRPRSVSTSVEIHLGSARTRTGDPMARIPYFDPADAVGPRAKKAYARLPDMNVFKMMGHSGELIDGFTKLATQVLNFTKLDSVLREIAIIRVAVLSNAKYELEEHERIGRRIGMSDELIAAVREGADAAAFTPLQRAVMRFTDDVVLNVRASDETFEPLRAELSYQELQELLIGIGVYMALARFLETFDVDLETKPSNVTVDFGRR